MKKIWTLIVLVLIFSGYQYWRSQRADLSLGSSSLILPIENPDQLRFLAFGDYGTGSRQQMKVAELAEELCKTRSIDALLLLGDNIYMDGVSSSHDPLWKTIIEEPFGSPCLAKLPLYPVLGNHDYKGQANAQIEYSLVNHRWKLPKRFYSVKAGKLLEIIGMDTNYVDICFDKDQCMGNFLLHRLEHSKARWKIVLGHHPVIGSSSKHTPGIQAYLLKPILCRFDAYLSAHSHHLEHIKPDNCHGEFFISGAGGAPLYPPKPGLKASKFAKADFGLLEMTVSPSSLSYRFVRVDGQELYRYGKLNVAKK